jgi:hypothetical protein
MAIPTYTGDTDIIASLATYAKDRNLTGQETQAKFDEGLTDFVTWFNETFIPALTAETSLTITGNTDAAPALGTLANNTEYRCTNASISTAPSMTIASISSTTTEFACSVIFKAPDTTPPVVTNNSGKTLKYAGLDVSSGTWTPVANTYYRMSIVFDGINLMAYISGVT